MTVPAPLALTTPNGERVEAQLLRAGELALMHRPTTEYAHRITLSVEGTELLRQLLNARQAGAPATDSTPPAVPEPIVGHDTFVVIVASTTAGVADLVAADLRRYVRDGLPAHVVTAGAMPL